MREQKILAVIVMLLVGCGVANATLYSTDFEALTGGGVTIGGQDGWVIAGGNDGDSAVDSTLVGSGQAAIIRNTMYHSSRTSHFIDSSEEYVTDDFTASFDLGFNVPNGTNTMEQAWVGFMQGDSSYYGAEAGIRIDGDKMKLAYKTDTGWVLGAEITKDKYYHYDVAVNLTASTYDVVVTDGATELMNVTGIALAGGETSVNKIVLHACSWYGSDGVAYFDNLNVVPEPATLTLLGLGAVATMIRRKK